MAITKVSNSVLKDLSVDTQNIVDDAVQTSKIVDSAVQTSKIADDAVQASKIADDQISFAKISNEFKTSIAMPSAAGPLVNLFPGVPIDIDTWQGTNGDSSISVMFYDGQDPNIALNQLAGATFTFTGGPIGSIQPGSYIIGSNDASFFGPGLWIMKFILNPTEQTEPVATGVNPISASFFQASQVPTVDFSSAQVFTKTLTADESIVFTNAAIGMVKDLVITGDFVITWPPGTKIAAGTYTGAVSNLIQVVVTAAGEYWLTISQEQV